MELEDLVDRPLAFLMVYERDDADDEWVILQTMVRKEGAQYILDLGPKREAIPFPDGLEDQVREVAPKAREVFDGAELYIPFLVEDLEDPENHEFLIALGVKWPGHEGKS